MKLRTAGDTSALWDRSALRAEHRQYWDNWGIKARTTEFGASKYVGERWLVDATLRLYAQHKASFYSDNASSETQYVSRNRQLGTFDSSALGAKLTYTWPGLPAPYDLKLTGAYERKRFRFKDFTDLRSGQLYGHDANVLQLVVSATF